MLALARGLMPLTIDVNHRWQEFDGNVPHTEGAKEGSHRAAGTAGEWNTHSNQHHATYKGMVLTDDECDELMKTEFEPELRQVPVKKVPRVITDSVIHQDGEHRQAEGY